MAQSNTIEEATGNSNLGSTYYYPKSCFAPRLFCFTRVDFAKQLQKQLTWTLVHVMLDILQRLEKTTGMSTLKEFWSLRDF